MAQVRIKERSTGRTGTVDSSELSAAMQSGYDPVGRVAIIDTASGRRGTIDGSELAAGLSSGLQLAHDSPVAAPETSAVDSALSYANTAGRGVAQGITSGFADEIVGAVESALTDKTYEQARDESRANFKAAADANPATDFISNLAGSVAQLALPGAIAGKLGGAASGLAKAASVAAKANPLKATSLIGGVSGAASTLGASESADKGELALETALGGSIGAAAPAVMKGIGTAGNLGKSWIGENFKSVFEPSRVMGKMLNVPSKPLGEALAAQERGQNPKLIRALNDFRKLVSVHSGVNNLGDAVKLLETQATIPGHEMLNEVADAASGVAIKNGLVETVPRIARDSAGNKYTEHIIKIADELKAPLEDAIERAGNDGGHAITTANRIANDLVKYGDDLGGLFKVKRLVGEQAFGKTNGQPINKVPASVAAYRRAYSVIDDKLEKLIGEYLPDYAEKFSEGNRLVSMSNVIGDVLEPEVGRFTKLANFAGSRFRDVGSGAITFEAARNLGADDDTAKNLGGAAMMTSILGGTIPGALMRANIGNAAKNLMPKITSAVSGITGKAASAFPAEAGQVGMGAVNSLLRSAAPHNAQTANGVADQDAHAVESTTGTLPKSRETVQRLAGNWVQGLTQVNDPIAVRAALTIAHAHNDDEFRAGMQQLFKSEAGRAVFGHSVQALTPTKYSSQVGGYVYTPEDRSRAAMDLENLGLSVTELAHAKMALARTGKLDPRLAGAEPLAGAQ